MLWSANTPRDSLPPSFKDLCADHQCLLISAHSSILDPLSSWSSMSPSYFCISSSVLSDVFELGIITNIISTWLCFSWYKTSSTSDPTVLLVILRQSRLGLPFIISFSHLPLVTPFPYLQFSSWSTSPAHWSFSWDTASGMATQKTSFKSHLM